MHELNATVICPGLAIGKARKLEERVWSIPTERITSEHIGPETEKLMQALEQTEESLRRQLDRFRGSKSDEEILRSHLLIIQDPELLHMLRVSIDSELLSAARAVQARFAEIRTGFTQMHNEYFAQKANDYKDVEHHLLAVLTEAPADDLSFWEPDEIAILSEVTPSRITRFAESRIQAYCTVAGSFTSHASILSRSLGICALTGIPGLLEQVPENSTLIVDALQGKLIIDPDQPMLERYRQLREELLEQASRELRDTSPLRTASGRRIKLRCNLDLPTEVDYLSKSLAEGVGLFRTEYLYLGKDTLPTEEQQYEVYRELAENSAPHSATIRTFDLGGDKLSRLIESFPEDNPNLGCRGLRFSLLHPTIFRTQVRAVLRAAVHGRIKLMFPMVMDLDDFRQAARTVRECQAELAAEGLEHASDIPLGVMVEIPSAALCARELAENCDFLSIGTNDLVQYTLAADRNNPALTDRYLPHHPAVLQLIQMTIEAANACSKPVSVCGEMASQPEYLPLLIGMGCSEFSVGSASLQLCREIVRRCDAALEGLVAGFDFSRGREQIEELIYRNLKLYHQL